MGSHAPAGSVKRRVALAAIACASVVGAVGAQFLPRGILDLRTATTPQLAGLLGLLVLPVLTLAAMMLDRTRRPRSTTSQPRPVVLLPEAKRLRDGVPAGTHAGALVQVEAKPLRVERTPLTAMNPQSQAA